MSVINYVGHNAVTRFFKLITIKDRHRLKICCRILYLLLPVCGRCGACKTAPVKHDYISGKDFIIKNKKCGLSKLW